MASREKTVFVSWSGAEGRRLGEALKETILSFPGLYVWVSSQDITVGAAWFNELMKALDGSKYAVGCLTPGSSLKPWVNFEAGVLFGRLGNFKLLLFDERLKGPLTNLQAIDGRDKEQLANLLKDMTGDAKGAEDWVKYKYPAWQKEIDALLVSREERADMLADGIREAVSALDTNASFKMNACFRAIIRHSLENQRARFRDLEVSFAAPAIHYPYHLIDLQDRHKARVRAIALVQHQEQFWQNREGLEIMRTAHSDCQRVFVFTTAEQLEQHWESMLQHARQYHVLLMSYQELAKRFAERYLRDFSVIDVAGDKVLAVYEEDALGKSIVFVAEAAKIEEHEHELARMIKYAHPLSSRDEANFEQVKASVFRRSDLTPLSQKPVEMSEYISVTDYDQHEEKHAYYREMMDHMIDTMRRRCAQEKWSGPINVLEFGAGTGIFTQRLLQEPLIEKVVAVELDWVCYNRLEHKFRDHPKLVTYNEDSRIFNPSGKYHFVVSSFADHHIKSQDKPQYFGNVKANLVERGCFIVGDEFLPPHDPCNDDDWRAALHSYHGHIIDAAVAAGEQVLAKLEKDALQSGLNRQGDFKVSCEQYEKMIVDSGLRVDERKLIGPQKAAKPVGGVYVYALAEAE